jgi:hypothetical protein
MHGLVALYLEDHACNHPYFFRTCCSSSPCCHIKNNRGIDHLDEDSQVGNSHDTLVALMEVAIFVATLLLVA